MIGAGISYYGASGFPPNFFLGGNAKIYDGSFDYDIATAWAQMERTQAFSVNIHLKLNASAATAQILFEQGASAFDRGIMLYFNGSNQLRIEMQNTGGNRLVCVFPFLGTGYASIILTYDGSSLASGINAYRDGVLLAKTVLQNNLTNTIISTNLDLSIGARQFGSRLYLNALIRRLEIINRVANSTEIAAAVSTGSFQGAGIALANYLLSIEFNKTGTANLTTIAGTPTYTITAFGGAAYTPYL